MMYTVAAYLVEQLSDLSFEKFLRHHFWKPLGMSSTNLQSKNAVDAGLPVAQPYVWREESNNYATVERQYSPEAVGAGLVVTSVNEYIKWVKALMNKEPPISEEVYDGLIKPRSFASAENADELEPFTSPDLYGAGLQSRYYRGYLIISHDGRDPGVSSRHFFLPQIKFGGVILGNSASAGGVLEVLSRELIDEALEIPCAERTDWIAWKRNMIAKDEKEEEEGNYERRKKLCPEVNGQPQPQQTPLSTYTCNYWNDGYRGMKVEINQDNKLFIDATDRTMGFTLEFEHLCNQTKYIAHMSDYYEGYHEEMAAEFVFEDDKVVKLGLELEEDLDGGWVWFDKVDDKLLPTRTV